MRQDFCPVQMFRVICFSRRRLSCRHRKLSVVYYVTTKQSASFYITPTKTHQYFLVLAV